MQQAWWTDDGEKCHKMFKNFKILEFRDYIWNHHEKCIQISTNMPSIGLVICVKKLFWEKKQIFYMVKPRAKCVNPYQYGDATHCGKVWKYPDVLYFWSTQMKLEHRLLLNQGWNTPLTLDDYDGDITRYMECQIFCDTVMNGICMRLCYELFQCVLIVSQGSYIIRTQYHGFHLKLDNVSVLSMRKCWETDIAKYAHE